MTLPAAQASIQTILDKATSRASLDDPNGGPAGVVFAAVNRKGEVLTKVAAGETKLGSGEKMKTDTVFAFYSCTKMIAGMAVMMEVEKGNLDLDSVELVQKHLPEVANATFADGRKPKRGITLRMLLTHTAGFSYTFFNEICLAWSQKAGVDEFCGSIEGFKGPLIAEPGEDWNYSTGIDWAGELLHRVTGLTLGEYCDKNIFKPLGANDIGFGVQKNHAGRLASMHQRGKDGVLKNREHLKMTTHGSTFDSGGAGCVGIIDDYLKIMVVLLNRGVGANGVRILKESTFAEMTRDQITHLVQGGVDPMERPIPNPNPELTDPVVMMPGTKKGWGLTFQILKNDLPTGRKADSFWWGGLPNNFWQADPTSGVATMILSQSFPFNDLRVIGPWLEAEAVVYGALQK
ncbi:beta-lactamase/transpeptidase-like protein [Meredithblackwellia eburnea MCA 4105]